MDLAADLKAGIDTGYLVPFNSYLNTLSFITVENTLTVGRENHPKLKSFDITAVYPCIGIEQIIPSLLTV